MPRAAVDIQSLAWDLARLGEAMESLAQRTGLSPRQVQIPAQTAEVGRGDEKAVEEWIHLAARRLGIEAEAVETQYAGLDKTLQQAGPALLRLPAAERGLPRYLALVSGGRQAVRLLSPDLDIRRVPVEVVRRALCADIEQPYTARLARLLAEVGVREERRERVGQAILAEQLSQRIISGGWLLRVSPASSLWRQAQGERLFRPLLQLFVLQIVVQVLMVLTWWLMGRGMLLGGLQGAELSAWALLLFTAIPFQMAVLWLQSRFTAGWGALFKQRLLYGTLKLNPDEIRHQGMGQFLARVMDASAVEALSLQGGMAAILSLVNLLTALSVMGMSAAGWIQPFLFTAWLLMTLFFSWRFYDNNDTWSEYYRRMADDLVERMVGHRTRLAQEDPRHWHDEEDAVLDRYIQLSSRLDRSVIPLMTIPFSWTIVGIATIAAPLAQGSLSDVQLAVSLGGIMLGTQALSGVVNGIQSMGSLAIAWKHVGPIFRAAARPEDLPSVLLQSQEQRITKDEGGAALTGRDLYFRYRQHGRPVLENCDVRVNSGDRILLEGPSGGGKSTLAAVLAGLRTPQAGLLLLRGYDRQSVGETAWRRQVVVAPQFHENHVFTETLGFNLLMGRRYPPTPQDLEEAEAICRELGLGDLLERMPSGMQQMVGESGWQLSHGERSRVYIARALLQQSEILVFDESFGALDPENLERALRCVLQRAPTLLVIAHP